MADDDRIDPHPSWAQVEPGSLPAGQEPNYYRPGEHEIELSKAISLKRIADALTGDTTNTGIGLTLAHIEQNMRGN